MRRLTLALSFSLLLTISLHAQQSPPPGQRPATPPPSATTPPASPASIALPGQQGGQGQQGPRPGTTAPPTMSPALAAAAGLQTGGSQNVHLAIKISDSFSSEVQTTKAVTMLVADRQSGQIRASGGSRIINIDARPSVQRDGRIWLQLSVEYLPDLSTEQFEQLLKASKNRFQVNMLTESITLVVADGKPTVVSQSSDPLNDRKVSLEVTATIVK